MANGSRLAILIVILGIIVALLALKFRIFAPLEMPRQPTTFQAGVER